MLIILGFNKEGQMSQGQMLTQQMFLGQLSNDKAEPGKLHLMFGQNRIRSNSSDIADIFMLNPTFVMVV